MSDEQITRDLITKVSDDVGSAMRRTLAIAPSPLPVATGAAAAAIGIVAAELASQKELDAGNPAPETILLAGLLCARMCMGGEDPIGDAYDDLRVVTSVRSAIAESQS